MGVLSDIGIHRIANAVRNAHPVLAHASKLRAATPKITAQANGVGAFVLPLRKLQISYQETPRRSQGLNEYIVTELVEFARQNPSVEVVVKHGRLATMVSGFYSGEPRSYHKKRIHSTSESVRGIWSPHNVAPHKI